MGFTHVLMLTDDVPDIPYLSDDDVSAVPISQSVLPVIKNDCGVKEPTERTIRSETNHSAFAPSYLKRPQKQTQIDVDVSDVGIGSIVSHKVFGTGKVVSIEKQMMKVSFDGTEKKFAFSGTFTDGFLQKL